MAVRMWELVHQCFTKHSRMGTATMKYDNETDDDCKKRGVSKEKSPDCLSLPNQNAILINLKWYLKKYGKKVQ